MEIYKLQSMMKGASACPLGNEECLDAVVVTQRIIEDPEKYPIKFLQDKIVICPFGFGCVKDCRRNK